MLLKFQQLANHHNTKELTYYFPLYTCWRKLVACAPYGGALSSLPYKHEQNARASGALYGKLPVWLHTLKEKNVRGDSPLKKKMPVWLHTL